MDIFKEHSKRVANLSFFLAKKLDIPDRERYILYQASLLHDIGKEHISKEILNKKGTLTKKEFLEIKKHPIIGANEAKNKYGIKNKDILDIILFHHEREDGKGYLGLYPNQLTQILIVADSFDVMINERSYSNKMSKYEVLEELIENKGTQFSPVVVDTLVKEFRNWENLSNRKIEIKERVKLVHWR